MKINKKTVSAFALAAAIGICSYLIGYDPIVARIIPDNNGIGGDIPGQDESVLDQEQAGQLEEGENDIDLEESSGDAKEDISLSDDRVLETYSGVSAGNYAWQSLDGGTLGSFGNVDWIAGYEFVPEADKAVTELCGFFDDSERGVYLYGQSFDLLASAAVKSDNGWNCVPIDPVDVSKGRTYYVVSKAENGPLYYKYQCCDPSLLPKTVSGVKISAGVRQAGQEKFGSGLKRYSELVFGLVDVKISKRGQAYLPVAGVRPVIIDPQPTGTISNSKPLLSVATDKDTTCKYSKTKKNYADMEYSFTTTGAKLHTKRIGALVDGNYTRYVRCKDADGKISYAKEISFTVKNASTADIYKPVISNPQPTGTISDNTPTISVGTDESATCKYSAKNVSYNSSSRTAFSATGGTAHSATLSTLNDGNYTYYVRCKDEAGNANISSKKIIFTVATGSSDTTPPAISSVAVSPASGEVGDTFTVTAKVTDAGGISDVQAKIQSPDGTTISTIAMKDDGSQGDGAAKDNTYGARWSSAGKAAGTYYVDIVATDTSSNSSTKDNGAIFTLTAAGSSCRLPYEPNKWNVAPTLTKNNCYNYACNKITNTMARPGRASGYSVSYPPFQCDEYVKASKSDGLEYLGISNDECSGCKYEVALFMDLTAPRYDYHWYRKDDNNMWSHKFGPSRATNLDTAGKKISDPRTSERDFSKIGGSGIQNVFCGFFCVDKTKVNIK